MKSCNKCGCSLIIGQTWTEKKQHYCDYRCTKCTTQYRKAWGLSRGDIEIKNRRRNHFRREYGITYEQFEHMLVEQNYKCAICSCDVSEKFNIDHCHVTKVVRGILCWDCNIGLGRFKDDITHLRNAITYLENNDG